MTDDTKSPAWNGIPDNPASSGWHWIGYPKRMEPFFWNAKLQRWRNDKSDAMPFSAELVEYLGPCSPPVSRCADGSRKVAVSAEFRPHQDQVYIRMNDGTGHYIDGWYWYKGQPVIDIVGRTIPEINAAQKDYRDLAQEGEAT